MFLHHFSLFLSFLLYLCRRYLKFVNNKIVNQMITIEQLKDVKERTDALRRYL